MPPGKDTAFLMFITMLTIGRTSAAPTIEHLLVRLRSVSLIVIGAPIGLAGLLLAGAVIGVVWEMLWPRQLQAMAFFPPAWIVALVIVVVVMAIVAKAYRLVIGWLTGAYRRRLRDRAVARLEATR